MRRLRLPPMPRPRRRPLRQGCSAAGHSGIAAAQASGKVWVNTDSGVYHKSGRWYGKTKQGKFMTESEAKAAAIRKPRKNN